MSTITDLQKKFDAAMMKVAQAFRDGQTKLDALREQIKELKDAAANGTVDPAELEALETDIGTTSDALGAQADAFEASLPDPVTAPVPVPDPTQVPDPGTANPPGLAASKRNPFSAT